MLKVRGYASVFGNVDSYGEIVDKGAFSDWLAAHPDDKVPLFWSHAHIFDILAKPIGHTTLIKQDKAGLYFEGEILDTPDGEETQTLLRGRGRMPASFAFQVVDQYQKGETWHLAKLDLKEVTATNWGANPAAYIEAVDEPPAEETTE